MRCFLQRLAAVTMPSVLHQLRRCMPRAIPASEAAALPRCCSFCKCTVTMIVWRQCLEGRLCKSWRPYLSFCVEAYVCTFTCISQSVSCPWGHDTCLASTVPDLMYFLPARYLSQLRKVNTFLHVACPLIHPKSFSAPMSPELLQPVTKALLLQTRKL